MGSGAGKHKYEDVSFLYFEQRLRQEKTESKTVIVEPKPVQEEAAPPKFMRSLSPMPAEASGVARVSIATCAHVLPPCSLCSFARTSGAPTLVSTCSEFRTALLRGWK